MSRLTTTTAEEAGRPAWSPDGASIAYLLGDELKYSAYDQSQLMVIPASGGAPRHLTQALDRPVSGASWSADGSTLYFTKLVQRQTGDAGAMPGGGLAMGGARR